MFRFLADCLGFCDEACTGNAISRDGAPQQGLRHNGATLLRCSMAPGQCMALTSRNTVPHWEDVLARALILIWQDWTKFGGVEVSMRQEKEIVKE